MQQADLLDNKLTFLPGVGEKRARVLEDELHLSTWRDLLYFFPYKHIDRTRLYRTDELLETMPYVQLRGRIRTYRNEGEGRKMRLVAVFADDYGSVDLVWFQGIKYIPKHYPPGKEFILFGRPGMFNGRINITHPDLDPVESLSLSGLGFQPYYHTTEKMKRSGLDSRAIERLTDNLFRQITEVPETLSEGITTLYDLMPLLEALKAVHYPTCAEELDRASYRIKFEELFYIQLEILRRASAHRKREGYVFPKVDWFFRTFYGNYLPFPLTNAQKRVIREIHADMQSGRQMNRLLQGDVGSGKTIVALMCALLAIDNHFQTCIMAPTEILAEQHLETFRKLLADMPVKVELLTGVVKGKKRQDVLSRLATGEINILIGTHAVIEDGVEFANLGFVVIDEQHRFGVAQRARLWDKSMRPPHILVMTATPIPRTLAMTLYGDLDVSVIDELPPGRKPIRTVHLYDERRADIHRLIRQEIARGQQIYIVYPLIQESERSDMKDLENGYLHVCEAFPEFRVSKVHGKMKPADKDAEMARFAKGETQILVATTVIEVGVNVPKASVMVIENAERFGLSQLHQLRGRVGRGADQSYCVLVTRYELGQDTRRRMQIMTETTDGFEIAEEDLKMRGPGELDGTVQSGMPFDLKLADLAHDGIILQRARDAASKILRDDPDLSSPANTVLRTTYDRIHSIRHSWGEIS